MTSRSPSPSQPEDDAATPSSPTISPAAEQNTDAPPDSALENGTLVVEDLDTPVGAAEPEVDLEEPARTSPVDEISPPLASQVDDKADEPTLEPSPQELTEESQLEGEDEPFTAVSLGGPTSRPTTPTHAPSGSHVGPTSPSSPSLSEAFSRRSRGDRTSFLISNATRQSENRQSFDGTSKLKEEFERLRSTHRRTSSHALEGQASGSSPRSSVHRGTSKGRRLSGQSRSSVQNGLAHGEEEAQGIAEEEDGELVDEPISPVDGQHEDVDWSFWGEVMNDYQQVARSNPTKLSQAIQEGIPDVIRGQIWQLMSSSKDLELENLYSSLLHESSPHEKAIQKDLTRTFPSHKFFQRPQSADGEDMDERGRGQDELFNVVKAYSLYDPDVGYVQGSAFIVASLLLNMPDEEAFCVWVRLMHSYGLRTSFLPEMPGLQLRLYQFDRLIEDLIPLLHVHFLRNGVKSSMYAGQWFLTLFSYRFPLDCVYRIFDAIFAEGIEAQFRFSIALLLKNEEELLKLNFEEIMKYLQTSLFDSYKVPPPEVGSLDSSAEPKEEEEWLSTEFVRDSFAVRITPFQLDGYTAEWDDLCRAANKHAVEVDELRTANRQLSSQVKQLESSLASLNTEHCQVVRDLVMAKVAREEMENELVKYKMLYAELSHQSAESKQRSSGTSFWSLGVSGRSNSSKDS